MFKKIVLSAAITCLVVSVGYSKVTKEDFEKSSLKGWEIEGKAEISTEQKHGGQKALKVIQGAKVKWLLETEDKFGDVSMWVYNSAVGRKARNNCDGPTWGIINSDGDYFKIGTVSRVPQSPISWGNLYFSSSLDNIYSWWYLGGETGVFSTKGWHKVVFSKPDAESIEVTVDEAPASALSMEMCKYETGFIGLIFSGGAGAGKEGDKKAEAWTGNNEIFFYDDIEINMK